MCSQVELRVEKEAVSMKRKLYLLCSVLALFCFISMYVPVIQPRYPAGEFYAPEGSYNQEYYYTGDYYYAREYWDMTRFVFAFSSVLGILGRIVFSFTQALLLLWAMMSVKGESKKMGLGIVSLNLVVSGFVLTSMLMVMGSCRWGVLAMQTLVAVTAVVMVATDVKET